MCDYRTKTPGQPISNTFLSTLPNFAQLCRCHCPHINTYYLTEKEDGEGRIDQQDIFHMRGDNMQRC